MHGNLTLSLFDIKITIFIMIMLYRTRSSAVNSLFRICRSASKELKRPQFLLGASRTRRKTSPAGRGVTGQSLVPRMASSSSVSPPLAGAGGTTGGLPLARPLGGGKVASGDSTVGSRL